jgi:hypothetical protein
MNNAALPARMSFTNAKSSLRFPAQVQHSCALELPPPFTPYTQTSPSNWGAYLPSKNRILPSNTDRPMLLPTFHGLGPTHKIPSSSDVTRGGSRREWCHLYCDQRHRGGDHTRQSLLPSSLESYATLLWRQPLYAWYVLAAETDRGEPTFGADCSRVQHGTVLRVPGRGK